MIPPAMRTGFDPLVSKEKPEITPLHIKLVSLVMLLLEYAITSAATFVEHQGRTIIGPEDIKRAIKKEAMSFFDKEDLESRLEEITQTMTVDIQEEAGTQSIRHTIRTPVDADEEWDGLVVPDEVGFEVPTGTCCCEACQSMTTVHEDWNNWDVDDDIVKTFLKQQIEKISADFEQV